MGIDNNVTLGRLAEDAVELPLRKKLGDAGKYICTVRKVGYKLTDSEEELEQ